MRTVLEYTKERLSVKEKSTVITMVLAAAKNTAKEAHREVSNQDLIDAARAHIKTLRKSAKELESKMDVSVYLNELKLTQEVFFPNLLSEEATVSEVNRLLTGEELTRKNRKNLEAKLVSEENLNWEVVANTLNTTLK